MKLIKNIVAACLVTGLTFGMGAHAAEKPAAEAKPAAVAAAKTVDLNTATEAELKSIKGIGAAKAKAIVEYRTKNGKFTSVNDLAKVKGVGKKTVDQVKNLVSVK